jgi:hypothetical protein
MHIVELRAENIKRLRAITIRPEGQVVEITGRNEQGKSSVLDAIWMALGGAEVIPAEPIRKGKDEAMVRLDMGEFTVTRKFRGKEDGMFTTSLVVETPDGMRPKSPQTLLNELVGRFTLDPLAFSRMKPGEQFDAMKALVPGFDFDASIAADKADYERRTGLNRKAKETKVAAEAIAVPLEPVDPVDEAPILADLARASDHNTSIVERKGRRASAQREIEGHRMVIEEGKREIAELQERIAELERQSVLLAVAAQDLEEKLAAAPPLPEPLDTAALASDLELAKRYNALHAAQEQSRALLKQANDFHAQAEALTQAMEDRARKRSEAIAAAKLPVEGLTLGEGEVLVDALPFAQAAASKKIRISVALAMALNPKIRVLRIMDGSLLDSDAMKVVADMAKEHDFQVWIERVDDRSPSAIVIEDGHIKEKV